MKKALLILFLVFSIIGLVLESGELIIAIFNFNSFPYSIRPGYLINTIMQKTPMIFLAGIAIVFLIKALFGETKVNRYLYIINAILFVPVIIKLLFDFYNGITNMIRIAAILPDTINLINILNLALYLLNLLIPLSIFLLLIFCFFDIKYSIKLLAVRFFAALYIIYTILNIVVFALLDTSYFSVYYITVIRKTIDLVWICGTMLILSKKNSCHHKSQITLQ